MSFVGACTVAEQRMHRPADSRLLYIALGGITARPLVLPDTWPPAAPGYVWWSRLV